MDKNTYPVTNKGARIIEAVFSALLGRDVYFGADWHPTLNDEIVQSLHGISSRLEPVAREVFLSNKGYGYVWCFYNPESFNGSTLCRIEKGSWHPLSDARSHPKIGEIEETIRKTYNSHPIKFLQVVFDNPYFDPCTIKDLIENSEPKRKIKILLAVESGNEMAEDLERILKRYEILAAV